MQRLLIAASLLCAVALLALPSSAAGGHRIFAMTGENGSGENGAVILTPLGDTTRVEIALANAPEAAIQPAHVHAGACFEVGKVVYPLIGDGRAGAFLGMKVHLSGKTHVICNDRTSIGGASQ